MNISDLILSAVLVLNPFKQAVLPSPVPTLIPTPTVKIVITPTPTPDPDPIEECVDEKGNNLGKMRQTTCKNGVSCEINGKRIFYTARDKCEQDQLNLAKYDGTRTGRIIKHTDVCTGKEINLYENELIKEMANDSKIYYGTKEDWKCYWDKIPTSYKGANTYYPSTSNYGSEINKPTPYEYKPDTNTYEPSYKYDYSYPKPTEAIGIFGSNSNYTQYGNTVYGSNGDSYSKYGNTIYGSNGKSYSQYGNTTYGSDGSSYSQYGNTTYGSDGTSYSQYGNTTYGSDGTSCTKYGNSTYCN